MANRAPAQEAPDTRDTAEQAPPPVSYDASAADPMDMLMAKFLAKFEARISEVTDTVTANLEAKMDSRIQAIQREVEQSRAEAQAREAAGLIAPPNAGVSYGAGSVLPGTPNTVRPMQPQVMTEPAPMDRATALQVQAAQRKVAFIPKDDPMNPRSLSFDTWINGKLFRIKRGDVGMLPLGHALDLARSGHGHVIDMAAWQQIPVPTLPDESLRPSDGPIAANPMDAGTTSIPPNLFGRVWN